jgi:hypothetical protein
VHQNFITEISRRFKRRLQDRGRGVPDRHSPDSLVAQAPGGQSMRGPFPGVPLNVSKTASNGPTSLTDLLAADSGEPTPRVHGKPPIVLNPHVQVQANIFARPKYLT